MNKGGIIVELKNQTINESKLNYADYPGSKGTIIAIHGLTGNNKQMHYYAELLKGEYRFISVDLKGRGDSAEAPENTGIKQHAADINQLIDELHIQNPIIMGYSMGAFIGATVASKRDDVQALILLDGAATCTEHQRNIVQPSLGRLSKQYSSVESYLEEIRTIYGNLGVTWTDHLEDVGEYEIHQVGDHWESKSDEKKITQDFNSFYEFVPKNILSKVDCPVLLVHAKGQIGQMPPLFYAEAYEDTKNFTKHIETFTSECNHYTLVFEERPEINAVITDFLLNISKKDWTLI